MKRNTIIIVIIAAVVVGIFALSNRGSKAPQQPAPAGLESVQPIQKAPEFSLKDYSGKTVALADFVSKPLVINSWAAWCPFCRKELIDFAQAQKEFSEQVVIIAVDRAESLETAKRYSDQLGVTNDLVFLLDPADAFYQSIGGFSMPETIFVNSKGEIVLHKRGPMELDEIKQKIQNLLEADTRG